MELTAFVLMIAGGCAIALFVGVAITLAERSDAGAAASPQQPAAAPDRTHLAASLLYNVLLLGGTAPEIAMREIRKRAGVVAPVTPGIDIASWAARFGQLSQPHQREWLLETAVALVASSSDPVPLRQYSALLDLSFSLGFHTDALAKLREQYGFEYVDHAKANRPREADRRGGAAPLFVRETEAGELLRVLEIEGTASRQVVISAYRRLAAQHHPDRFYDQSAEAQQGAAARFIEITRAYEALLTIYRD